MKTYEWKNLQHGLLMDIEPSGPHYDRNFSVSHGVFYSEEEAFDALDKYCEIEGEGIVNPVYGMNMVLICTYVSNN